MEIEIVVFGFNRPVHLKETLTTLGKHNEETKLPIHIYLDGPRTSADFIKVKETENIAMEFSKSHESVKLTIRKRNLGLRKSIISGITESLLHNDAVIVLEDDIEVGESFLSFMVSNLNRFEMDSNIGSVTGYSYLDLSRKNDSLYEITRHSSWGWGIWKDRWTMIDWEMISNRQVSISTKFRLWRQGPDMLDMLRKSRDGRIDSWSISFDTYCASKELKCICPNVSLIQNIGRDGSGVHEVSSKSERKFHLGTFSPTLEVTRSKLTLFEIWFVHSRLYFGIRHFKRRFSN